jgi:GNAT superfamily N-acetyltransferase
MSDPSVQPSAPATVRAIRPGEVPRVWEMLRGLAEYEKLTHILTGTPELLREALFGPGPRLEALVAERGGRLVGYALFYPVFGSFRARWRIWLEDLFVEPDERGGGAGAALMAELARIALERECYSVDWEVLDWNQPSIEFYERLGSKRIATDWYRYRLHGEAMKAMAERATHQARDAGST